MGAAMIWPQCLWGGGGKKGFNFWWLLSSSSCEAHILRCLWGSLNPYNKSCSAWSGWRAPVLLQRMQSRKQVISKLCEVVGETCMLWRIGGHQSGLGEAGKDSCRSWYLRWELKERKNLAAQMGLGRIREQHRQRPSDDRKPNTLKET